MMLSAPLAWAGCTGSSPTWETTPDYASLSACVAGLQNNDTLNVTAGGGTSEITSTLVVPSSGVKIIGPGAANLTLTWTGNYVFSTASKSSFRISGFTFATSTYQTSILVKGGTGWMIDNNIYTNTGDATSTGVFVIVDADAAGASYGLIHSNTVNAGRVLISHSTISSAMENTLWVSDLNLGTSEAVYIEDNTFNFSPNRSTNCVDSNRASRYVARYNTINGQYVMAHSQYEGGSRRGSRKWEIYGNNMSTSVTTWIAALYFGAGSGTIFANQGSGYDAWLFLDNTRDHYGDVADNTTYAGRCDGDNVTDGNTNPNPASGVVDGWPCRDQIGRSSDSGAYPSNQASVPAMFWLNRSATAPMTIDLATGVSASHIVADRDYYISNASFNGTSGIGCGTFADIPATCTTGVSYWATTQSCSDLTGMVGANPVTPISGTLYKCTETDTWTAYYTPYTYPHPLRDVTAPDSTITQSDPQAITSDALTLTGTCTDAVGVASVKYRLSNSPDASNGTVCTGTTSWTCNTGGYSIGANDVYVGCADAAGNWTSPAPHITANFSYPSGAIAFSSPGTGAITITPNNSGAITVTPY
jgi:hypothetical protein